MITLLLNNKQAIIKNGTSIKLTRENPFFTGSGDYTLDVTLPLAGCKQNLEVLLLLERIWRAFTKISICQALWQTAIEKILAIVGKTLELT